MIAHETLNAVTLIAELGGDPDYKPGAPELWVSVATYHDEDGDRVKDWHRVKVTDPATIAALVEFARRGDLLLVRGRIEYGVFDHPETHITIPTFEILAEEVRILATVHRGRA